MRVLVAVTVALLAFTQAADGGAPPPSHANVRGLTPEMTAVLEETLARSATVRALVAAIDQSDVIVYLTDSSSPQGDAPHSYMRFIAASDVSRFVVIWVDRWMRSPSERMEMLGHELQHAAEFAADRAVRDIPSFAALYRRIGRETTPGRFETAAAEHATLRIRAELQKLHADPAGGPSS